VSVAARAFRHPSVAFLCDTCGAEIVQSFGPGLPSASCGKCGRSFGMASEAPPEKVLSGCLRCGESRLYVQKDFNKKLGLWVFVVAAVLSVPTWGLSLLAATLIDLALYFALNDATLCYGCGAVHRGFVRNPVHAAFDIHTQETVDRRMRAV
jgi:hypothetical protein